MPATAGRVRMPANNRVHSSAALQTHGIWQSAIGYDPYAPTNNNDKDAKYSADRSSAGDGGDDGENAYASFQGLLALARITVTNADDTRGACKRCGRVGHLSFQCRNFFSLKAERENGDAAADEAAAMFNELKKGSGRKKRESEEEEEEEESSDSDLDQEIEKIIAAGSGKKAKEESERRGRSKDRNCKRSRRDDDEGENEEKSRRKEKRRYRGSDDEEKEGHELMKSREERKRHDEEKEGHGLRKSRKERKMQRSRDWRNKRKDRHESDSDSEVADKHLKQRKKENTRGRIITFSWEKPEESWLKLNVDGCARSSHGPSAAGGLLRNSSGDVILSFCMNLGSSTAYFAELQAARMGLRICMQKGLRQVWLEMDSMILVNQINSKFQGNWQTFEAFLEIRKILSSIRWRCSHIWREANAAADLLAQAGLASPPYALIIDPKLCSPIKDVAILEAAGMKYWRRIKRK